MHISLSIIVIFNFDVFYMFRTQGSIFRKAVVHTVMARYVLLSVEQTFLLTR
jgi:hypothetical protein